MNFARAHGTSSRSSWGFLAGGGDREWTKDGACVGKPYEWWDIGESLTEQNREAKKICLRDCPVRAVCEQDARDHGDHGVIRAGYAFVEGRPRGEQPLVRPSRRARGKKADLLPQTAQT